VKKNDRQAGPPPASHRSRTGIVGFIGGYLIDQGTLTLEQLDAALLFQLRLAETGEHLPLEDTLVRLRMADEQDIASAKEKQQRDLGRRAR
jgi:hypothetical protein